MNEQSKLKEKFFDKGDSPTVATIFHMMTSSNGNIFRVTGPFCVEFIVEFPSQRLVTRSFGVFCLCLNNGWVNNRDAGDLRRHRAHRRESLCNERRHKSPTPRLFNQ